MCVACHHRVVGCHPCYDASEEAFRLSVVYNVCLTSAKKVVGKNFVSKGVIYCPPIRRNNLTGKDISSCIASDYKAIACLVCYNVVICGRNSSSTAPYAFKSDFVCHLVSSLSMCVWPVSSVQVGRFLQTAVRRFRLFNFFKYGSVD